jgi:hypothetical protein
MVRPKEITEQTRFAYDFLTPQRDHLASITSDLLLDLRRFLVEGGRGKTLDVIPQHSTRDRSTEW